MIHVLTRWPAWYQILIVYTGMMGLWALRAAGDHAASLKPAASPVTAPYDKGHLAGQRAAIWMRALTWFVGAALLLTGAVWALTLVAAGYAHSARRAYPSFAQGVADGRTSVELAASREHVAGRGIPDRFAFLLAGVFITITRLLPLGTTLVAMTWLHR